MKTKLRIWVVMAFVFATTNPSLAQWIQTNGPYGGSVSAFIVSDSILFTTNSTYVFRSTNNGTNWTQVDTDLWGFTGIRSFAEIGANLFAGGDYGFFLSTDNGTSWAASNTGLTNRSVRVLTVSGTNLFAGTNGGVFLSTNSGASWTAASTGLTNTSIGALAVSGTNLFAGTSGGVFLSTDNGTSWNPADSGLPNPNGNVVSFCFSDTTLFCGIDGSGVFRSSDNGASWTEINSGLTSLWCVHQLFMNDTDLFVGCCNGLFRSTDFGASWVPAGSGLPNVAVSGFGVNGPNLFAGTEGAGAFRSTDNGTSWTQINQGMSVDVKCLAVNGMNLYAGTEGAGIFLTTDNGTSWTAQSSSNAGGSACVNTLAVTDTTIFAADAGSSKGVRLSTDKGESWIEVNLGLTNTYVAALAILDTNVFAGTEGGGVFRSSNNGTSWTQADSGLTSDTVWALASNGTKIFAGTVGGLFLSTNDGENWIQVNKALKFSSAWPLAAKGDSLFLSTEGGTYVSTDNGISWILVPGLSKNDIIGLAATKKFLFAATPLGVWKHQLSPTQVADRRNNLPEHYSLSQNFPNPFNPSTTIRYGLPTSSRVSIMVYNMLGQQVAELVNEEQSAGWKEVQWNANISSGMYIYRMTVGAVDDPNKHFVDTKKMLLLR